MFANIFVGGGGTAPIKKLKNKRLKKGALFFNFHNLHSSREQEHKKNEENNGGKAEKF